MDAILSLANATVHRAAANDVDFEDRAARGSVWNGLFVGFGLSRDSTASDILCCIVFHASAIRSF